MRDWILAAVAAVLAALYINAGIRTGAFEAVKECVFMEGEGQ
jgi:hypothetical protein